LGFRKGEKGGVGGKGNAEQGGSNERTESEKKSRWEDAKT